MKSQIIGALILAAVLGALYFLLYGGPTDSVPASSGRPDAEDIRNLRIN